MRRFDSLDDWLHYFEHRHATSIQLGLDRFKRALSCFSLTFQDKLVFTVAGTNGKGSTVSALDAIYSASGYCVGRYTSPHLFRFNERICVEQHPVSDSVLCRVFEKIDGYSETLCLTYFEIATLAALLIFHEANVDVIILEVGMGGRLDATNAIDADLSIITTVDLDHQAWLGDTKEAIGVEKAGILRAFKPAIYADIEPPLSVIAQAKTKQTKLYRLGRDYCFTLRENTLSLKIESQIFDLPRPSIQPQAAAAAIFASLLLKSKYPIQMAHWVTAMQKVHIIGRQQWIPGEVRLLFDVAHNPQAVALLAQTVARCEVTGVVRAVFAVLKDKDICGLIRPMAGFVNDWYPALLDGSRRSSQDDLDQAFERVQLYYKKCYNTPVDAFNAALQASKAGDVIVVFGSFLTVSAVLSSQSYTVEER